jgi:hypothetical protein
MSFDQRLYGFLFDPAAGVQVPAVRSLFSVSEQALLDKNASNETQLRKLAAGKLNAGGITQIDLKSFEQSIGNKLPLLTTDEWHLLGLGVALLPFVGRIARSMDGNFRRGIRTVLEEADIEALDALEADEQLQSMRLNFLAPSVVWKNIDVVQAGGINAILEQLCTWPKVVTDRTLWKFTATEQKVGPIVTGLQPQHIEVLCKILLPSHPWLLSSSQTQ